MEWGNTLLDDHVLALSGAERPRVCFLPTASGDADHYVVRFYRAFAATRCEPSHISLFRRETGVGDPRAHLLAQDVIYVGAAASCRCSAPGARTGSTCCCVTRGGPASSCAAVRRARLCWFAQAVSAFHEGPPSRVAGLGLLPWSNAVHYDEEAGRQGAFREAVADGFPPGFGVGDGAALHFVGAELAEVVSSRPGARAVQVWRDAAGEPAERELPVRYLGAPAVRALAA